MFVIERISERSGLQLPMLQLPTLLASVAIYLPEILLLVSGTRKGVCETF